MEEHPKANPQQIMADDPKQLSVISAPGAVFQPINTRRAVKMYAIQEHELEGLNDLGFNTTVWASIGSSLLALAVNCLWDIIKSPKGTVNDIESGAVAIFAALSVVAFVLSFAYHRRKKSRLAKILGECTVLS